MDLVGPSSVYNAYCTRLRAGSDTAPPFKKLGNVNNEVRCGPQKIMSGVEEPNDNPAFATPTETFTIRTTRREAPAPLRPAAVNRRATPSSLEPFSATDSAAVTQAYWTRRHEGLLLDATEGDIQELSIEAEPVVTTNPDAAVVDGSAAVEQPTVSEAGSNQENVDPPKIVNSEVITVCGSKIDEVASETDRRG
jgi:hypothetical protein